MTAPSLHAVIHLGAHSVRLCIAERLEGDGYRELERLDVPLMLGAATFDSGRIDHALIRRTCEILANFRDVVRSYGVSDVAVIATSAVREAVNRDTVVDRVRQTTGMRVEVIEPMEETRLVHRLVREVIGDRFGMNRGATMVLSLGGGGSQMILFRNGEVVFSESRKVGTVRLRRLLGTEGSSFGDELDLFVTNVAQTFGLMHDFGQIDTFVAINNTLHDVLPSIAQTESVERAFTIAPKEIEALAERLQRTPRFQLLEELPITEDDLDTLLVALPQVQAFVGITDVRRIVIPNATFVDALMVDEIAGERERDLRDFAKQVESAALHLGRKYHFHEEHAVFVRDIAMLLFDNLRQVHGMEERDRLYLAIGALLHDIGWFVSAQSHHKHAAYLIRASEILGLDDEERNIVAMVARYHRRTEPRATHAEFRMLSPSQRTRVAKMAALLRIADALDRDLTQSVRDVEVACGTDAVTCRYALALERRASAPLIERSVKGKSKLFEDTFGLPIRLQLASGAFLSSPSNAIGAPALARAPLHLDDDDDEDDDA